MTAEVEGIWRQSSRVKRRVQGRFGKAKIGTCPTFGPHGISGISWISDDQTRVSRACIQGQSSGSSNIHLDGFVSAHIRPDSLARRALHPIRTHVYASRLAAFRSPPSSHVSKGTRHSSHSRHTNSERSSRSAAVASLPLTLSKTIPQNIPHIPPLWRALASGLEDLLEQLGHDRAVKRPAWGVRDGWLPKRGRQSLLVRSWLEV